VERERYKERERESTNEGEKHTFYQKRGFHGDMFRKAACCWLCVWGVHEEEYQRTKSRLATELHAELLLEEVQRQQQQMDIGKQLVFSLEVTNKNAMFLLSEEDLHVYKLEIKQPFDIECVQRLLTDLSLCNGDNGERHAAKFTRLDSIIFIRMLWMLLPLMKEHNTESDFRTMYHSVKVAILRVCTPLAIADKVYIANRIVPFAMLFLENDDIENLSV